jgi:hypothetical protein
MERTNFSYFWVPTIKVRPPYGTYAADEKDEVLLKPFRALLSLTNVRVNAADYFSSHGEET